MISKIKYQNLFFKYIENSTIDFPLRKIITDNVFINSNPEFYLYYPSLFSEYFDVNDENTDLLCIAGYLYYQATIYLDKVIDDKNFELLFVSMVCQEEAIKILTTIFPLDSKLWKKWTMRKTEYQNAILLEKQINNNPNYHDYKELAVLKSTFGNYAIDSLFELDKNRSTKTYEILLKSHAHFSVAYQLNDDILDFIDDYKNGQFNWCVNEFDKKYFDKYTIEDCKKLFYIEGFATKIFVKGIEELDKSINLLSENGLGNSLWLSHILNMKIKFENSIREIDSYLFQLDISINKSNLLVKSNNLNLAIKKSIEYIKKGLIKGQWFDYYNQGGISNIWATSFVLSQIVSNKELKLIFKKEIEHAFNFIRSSMSSNFMWSYNSTWIEDCDSTNFALISLYFNQETKNFNHSQWLSYFNSDFFSTYNDSEFLLKSLSDKNIENVGGWCSSHHCVSAVSLYYLSLSKEHQNIRNQLVANFKQLDLQKINSYWWSDKIYTLYFLFLSYSELNDNEGIEEIQNFIYNRIHNGFYTDSYGKNLFYTAFALEILSTNPKFSNMSLEIANSLLSSQFDDGSWESSNSLCIPFPQDANPNNNNLEIQNFGVGVRSPEFNRLFTTTSSLKSLLLWKNTN